MNNSDGASLITPSPHTGANVTKVYAASKTTSLPGHTQKTMIEAMTTASPSVDSAVVAVVITVIVLTFVVVAFLLYRYLCHNKGAYRTTGELAPGEDPDEDDANRDTNAKKEYFI